MFFSNLKFFKGARDVIGVTESECAVVFEVVTRRPHDACAVVQFPVEDEQREAGRELCSRVDGVGGEAVFVV